MKRISIIAALILLACTALAGSADDEALEDLAFEYISDLTNFSPANATLIGDHSADLRLDNVDAAARERSRILYEEYQAALDTIDRQLIDLIQDYAANYQTLTDAQAEILLDEYLWTESDRLALKNTFKPKFRKVLSARELARYYQIENKLESMARFEMVGGIPLVKVDR